ncbi:MAG: rRNA maturation RNAse YbeY, partial [Chloroflexi bacterium]|nr:rRNA maturation RNAse YbeY [Chloroflexota bacterium]
IHGVLHLLGYDHATPEQQRQMSAEEAAVLSSVQDEM